MVLVQTETEVIYNPSALLNIFTSSLNNETTRKVFKVKGIYSAGNGISYKSVYYDTLRDETSEACMTLVVPGVIRAQLNTSQIIQCNAYLTKKVQLNGGKIDLQLNVVELLAKLSSTYSDEQLKAFELLKKKAELGHKDVDGFVKTKIINGETIIVNILIGKAGIIDSDIKHQLQEAITFYKFHFIRINLTSEKEIIESLSFYQRKCDILAIARGGGENLEIFDSPAIAETSLSLSTHFITALGHKENVPLLQKVADKYFITPTALGQYFNEIYNTTIEQLQSSKAKLVENITRQLEANYGKQVENLNKSIENQQKSNERDLIALNQQLLVAKEEKVGYITQIEELKLEVKKAGKISIYTILLLVAALIIGLLIGRLIY